MDSFSGLNNIHILYIHYFGGTENIVSLKAAISWYLLGNVRDWLEEFYDSKSLMILNP